MECLAAIQRGQQHPKQLKPDTHSHSGTTSLVASVGSKVSVQLHATELVAELIANTQQPDAGSAEHPGEPLSTQEPCWGLGDFLKVCLIALLGLPDVLSSTHQQVLNACSSSLLWSRVVQSFTLLNFTAVFP